MQFEADQIKLIVGLGNIGKEYEMTRHNAGFMFIDKLADELQRGTGLSVSGWKDETQFKTALLKVGNYYLAKPTTMMNSSGEAIQLLCNYYKIEPDEVVVVHDDLDIDLGAYKIQFARGPKDHNGILSVNKMLGTDNYWRIRLGIETRGPESEERIPGVAFTLQKFNQQEYSILTESIAEVIEKNFI